MTYFDTQENLTDHNIPACVSLYISIHYWYKDSQLSKSGAWTSGMEAKFTDIQEILASLLSDILLGT